MTNYLWIGAIAEEQMLTKMADLGNKQATAYKVQSKLISGFESQNLKIDSLTGHVMPVFPRYKKMVIHSRHWQHRQGSNDEDVSFLNLPVVNIFTKTWSLCKKAKLWAKQKKGNNIIFVYSLHSPFLKAAVQIKKRYPDTKIIVFVPDLPEFMSSKMSLLKRGMKKINRISIDKCVKEADYFVLFSEPMKEKLPIFQKPYYVMEGIVDIKKEEYLKIIENKRFSQDKKIIMLSGTLNKADGIELLLKGFLELVGEQYALWITGQGDKCTIQMLQQYCLKDSRIHFFGYLSSYEKFIKLQKQATVFTAMVSASNPKSRYFFPSKIMEYLITGSPVVTFHLDCIPEEYDKHLFYFEHSEPKAIAKKIKEVCGLSAEKLREMAIERYELLKRKTNLEQTKKIIALKNPNIGVENNNEN